jgi:hypothetical protein
MFTISFNFDETTKKVSNLKVTIVDETVPPDENYISVQDNKLKFGKDALSLLNVSSGDRIQVTY